MLEGDAVREFEPTLAKNLNLLAVMHDHGYTQNPGAYIAALASEAEKLGGATCHQAEVQDFHFTDARVSSVMTTTGGALECDNVILATGVWSGPLAKKLGLKVPLETERGYHMVFKSPENGPSTPPLMVTTGKFVATPMDGGLRCAGIVEFGGLEAGPSQAPLALLERKVRESFPGLTYESTETWLGHRPPAPPTDSLPLIGEIGATGVLTGGFGHHHIGLTAGPPKTGRILAGGIVSGDRENTDLSPYDPMRF